MISVKIPSIKLYREHNLFAPIYIVTRISIRLYTKLLNSNYLWVSVFLIFLQLTCFVV